MVKQTKKVYQASKITTTVASGEYLMKVDANGKVTIISLDNLKTSIYGGMNMNAIEDGIFIMFHRNSDNYPLMVKPHKWPSYQSSGEIAEGVVIVEGGKILVVAPTETALTWSSAAVSGGATTTTDRITAMNDWAGRANTTAIIAHSTSSAVTNTSSYAPGYCNNYSRVNANSQGMTAGKWWLPSLGEMMMIYANMTKVNYALSLINGADQLQETWYWTSTEYSATTAWRLTLSSGTVSLYTKASDTNTVRAVSAFLY